MTYNANNLPDQFFTPPVPAPNRMSKATWARNWSIYYLYMHWSGPRYKDGRLTTIANWVNSKDRKKAPLTKQRIHAIAKQVHWLLKDYHAWPFEIME